MRSPLFALAALALGTAPLPAQISARVHIDIPILGTRHGPVVVDRRDDVRVIVVRDYSSRNHGQWRKEYRKWRPVTLYYLGGRYYERPFRNARPVAVYQYRDQYFFGPNDRDFYRMRDRDRDGRGDRWDDRDGRRGDDRYDDRYDDRARRRN